MKMEQIEVILESKGSLDKWSEVLELFGDLEETERRRYSWVTPTVADLKWLKDIFANHKVDRMIGVGCGSGFLERVISDYCGVPVTGIELDAGWWTSRFHPTIFIPIEFTNSPIDKVFTTSDCFRGYHPVLLFCYFNNSKAFNEYLKCFQAETLILIGPKDNVGIHTDPLPLSPSFDHPSEWTFVDYKYLEDDVNVICMYKRRV